MKTLKAIGVYYLIAIGGLIVGKTASFTVVTSTGILLTSIGFIIMHIEFNRK